jgi:nucleoside-diphosphate-sugar epimerase
VRALVTGSAGFIGQHVAAALTAAGYQVTGWDVVNGNDVRYLAHATPGWFDLVVHCAAVVGGRKVIDWSPMSHAANLEIDAAFFQWAQASRPGRVVYFSSSCAYPVRLGVHGRPLREDDIRLDAPRQPDGLYGWAKLTGELLAATYDGPVTVVRPFSVYGPGMKEGFAVTGFCEQAANHADPLVIWGDDTQVRDYIDVRDVAAAVLALAGAGVDGPVNLGTGHGTTLAALASMVAAAHGYTPAIKVDDAMPAGVPSLVADTAILTRWYQPQRALTGYLGELS